jgi:hypothetical protein
MKADDFTMYETNFDCMMCGDTVDPANDIKIWNTELGRRFFCADCTEKRRSFQNRECDS